MNIRNLIPTFDAELDLSMTPVLRWIFGDAIFAIIPLLVVAFIVLLTGGNFKGFLLLKEWPFASVILYGVTIRRFIRLKTQVQLVPTSYKLDTGVQLFIVMLIGSVLTLSFVLLLERGLLPRSGTDVVAASQLFFFSVGMLSLFLAEQTEHMVFMSEHELPKGVGKGWALERVAAHLGDAEEELRHVAYMLEKITATEFTSP
jgi:hypothetical protein